MTVQRQRYSAEEEQALMTQLWSPQVADDPETFVMFAFPWGEKNTPLEHFKGPRAWQREVLRSITRHIRENKAPNATLSAMRSAIASGRGIGKSALVSWLILWMLSTRIGSSVIVSANSEPQLRSVTWGELTKWAAMLINAHWWEPSATKLVPAGWLTSLVERDLSKGTRYWGAEGKLWSEENPDAYAGVHNHDGMMVIFDEASGIPDSIWSVAAGFFTEPIVDRYWMAFSNPRRPSGYFYECFSSRRDFWQTRQIDARTVEGTDKAVYDQIIAEHGEDSREARIEVYGQFPTTGDDQFIDVTRVDQAMMREVVRDPSAPIVVGVDPARSGADSTVIAVRRGREVLTLRRYKGDDTMTVVGHVINTIEEYRPVLTVVDEGGLGAGVLDRLKEQRYKVRGVNFGWKSSRPAMYGNKRAEMWGALKDWLSTASIPRDKNLRDDLTGPKVKPNSAGAIFLESKKEMKARGLASPDAADALAVTFAFPIGTDDPVLNQRSPSHSRVAVPTVNYWNATR
ncbi:MAG: terminase [Ilumatobacteraceae bacterium]